MIDYQQAIVLDIETVIDQQFVCRPEVTAAIEASVEIPANYSKPETIAAYRAQKLDEKLERAALDFMHGKVRSIGWADLYRDEEPTVMAEDDEREVLREFARYACADDPSVITGFCVRKFDIPFLTLRCALHGIELPHWWPHPKSYTGIADPLDLSEAWGKSKLEQWLQRFDLPAKTGHGSEVAQMSLEELEAYNANDVHVERLLMRKLASAFPQLRVARERVEL